jgi:hypothetical protein
MAPRLGAVTCALASMLVACTQDHHVELWLGSGSSAADISQGFQCEKPTGGYLFEDATVKGTDMVEFALVVDLIELGDGLAPMCLAEDILDTCRTNHCEIANPRACANVTATVTGALNPIDTAQAIETWLQTHAADLITDAPSYPVIVRVVAAVPTGGPIATPCTAIPTTGFSGYEVVGCAYSCVLQLQNVSDVQIGLDIQGNLNSATCTQTIDQCANFPENAGSN